MMTTEQTKAYATFDSLGAHRHLLVSERTRLRRHQLGLTQKEVVARLRTLGVITTNKAVSSLEHGAGQDVCKLPEIARALDCTLTYLVGLTDDPARWEPDAQAWAKPTPVAAASPPPPEPRPHRNGGNGGPRILGPLDTPLRKSRA